MYQIPKPPNQHNPKETIIILTAIGLLMMYNRYRWK
jgi:hypothetical protein